MLKKIPEIISPELIKLLMEMGHGEEIVLGDGNFPTLTYARRIIRCDGHSIPELLTAILEFFPLDNSIKRPVMLMAPTSEANENPIIWNRYKDIIGELEHKGEDNIEYLEKYDFYERASKSVGVITTSERARFANIIIRKGIVSA